MGPIWGRQYPGGPHVGPMNFAVWVDLMVVQPNCNSPISQWIFPIGEQPKQHKLARTLQQLTDGCRTIFHKYCCYKKHYHYYHYNKFDFTKSLGAYYWYVKIPQCGYTEHEFKYIAFNVHKHITPHAVCHKFPLVRDKLVGAPASMKWVY